MRLPLYERHERLQAHWHDWLGVSVPGTYGDTRAEYEALRRGVGVIDMSQLGKLRVTGDDRIAYLQGQLSQDVEPLRETGAGAYACLLKPTGQILSDMVLFSTGEELLMLTPHQTLQTVHQRLEQFVIMEEVEFEDVTGQFVLLHVAGPQCLAPIKPLGLDRELPLWHCRRASFDGYSLTIVRTDRCGEMGYDLLAPVDGGVSLWQYLLNAGAHPVGYEAWNIRRVEAGIPLYGIDMDENIIPLEAGLGERAVSFTKGCYTGQEVVHRIFSRGHTNRSLVGLRLQGETIPPYRATLSAGDRQNAGWVTSAVRSPSLEAVIALGYLRNQYTAPGTSVTVLTEPSPLSAQVSPLPFVEPSRA